MVLENKSENLNSWRKSPVVERQLIGSTFFFLIGRGPYARTLIQIAIAQERCTWFVSVDCMERKQLLTKERTIESVDSWLVVPG